MHLIKKITPAILSLCSERQRARGRGHQQIIQADLRTHKQADQPVWSGRHPSPQAFPHGQPQYPGPVAPLHQQSPVHRTNQTATLKDYSVSTWAWWRLNRSQSMHLRLVICIIVEEGFLSGFIELLDYDLTPHMLNYGVDLNVGAPFYCEQQL